MTKERARSRLRTSELLFLRESGFTNREIRLLVAGRERFRRGLYSDETPATKRLRFGKWLVDHGRVNEGDGASRGSGNAGIARDTQVA